VNTVKPVDDDGSEGSVPVVAGVDAGMTTLLRPAMYDAYHAIRNLTADRPTRPVTVAGPVCETADLFCEERSLPAARRGDLLAVGSAGAYG
jgi:diaminopimelate decarboxylase